MSAQMEMGMDAAADMGEEVQCVMIPLAHSNILLPNVCVAEILPWRRIKALQSVPDWMSGILGWRGETVPVVNFELLNEHPDSRVANGRCLVVMNRAGLSRGPAFYGIVAEGLPRLLQVAAEDLVARDENGGPYTSAHVQLGTEAAVIPDLERLERQIKMLGLEG
ncbi:MAG: chemotaxis protein CheW [Pseudomonadales bacterium]